MKVNAQNKHKKHNKVADKIKKERNKYKPDKVKKAIVSNSTDLEHKKKNKLKRKSTGSDDEVEKSPKKIKLTEPNCKTNTIEDIEKRIFNKLKRRQKYRERRKQRKIENKKQSDNEDKPPMEHAKKTKSKNKYKNLVPQNEENQKIELSIPSNVSEVMAKGVEQRDSSTIGKKSKKSKKKSFSAGDSSVIHTTVCSPADSVPLEEDNTINITCVNNLGIKKEKSSNSNSIKKSKKFKKKTYSSVESDSAVNSPVESKFNINKLKQVLSTHRECPTKETLSCDAKEEQEALNVIQKPVLSLGERMKEQLSAARFRHLNEQLYTSTGDEAYELMHSDPDGFQVYHEGFQRQVKKWPENPLDRVIKYVKNKGSNQVIADFGCGDAKLAQSVTNKVHSFDLVSVNSYVTACNMSNLPLPSESIDTGVFCLSLMGTNLTEFICEAHRVMKTNGTLLVAEVVSRFEKIGSFVSKMEKLGFSLAHKDTSNKMFVWFEFRKNSNEVKTSALPQLKLAPCIYKRR